MKLKIIHLLPYNQNYPNMFEQEAKLIKQILGEHCINLEHIGSTAVPNLISKQDLDILCVIDNLENSLILEKIGYIFKGELNVPLRYYFSKNTAHSKVNLHVVDPIYGNSFINLNLSFRDYLIANDDAKQEYAVLKTSLLKNHRSYQRKEQQFSDYNLGKNQFIKHILAKIHFNELHVNFCMHHEEWQEYHRIKEQEIFIPINVTYDPMHPSMTQTNHKHFVLYKGVTIVAIAHIEFLINNEAALRVLATDKLYQNNGYGSYLLHFLEQWLKNKNINIIKMHARLSAENFYRQLGYIDMLFDDPCINEQHVNLGKVLLSD